ncbi:MAG: hypothetical protein L3J10_04770 [Sulfurimonas sp.]|nr:hypothetical protein [Sulfurimonas sp.]
MFDFLDNDWFIIGLEVVFLIIIIYDVKKYIETRKKDYIVNIVLTLGFAIWTLSPIYTSYFGWENIQKEKMLLVCNEDNNETLCTCLSDTIFKEYTYDEYMKIKDLSEYMEFIKDSKEDCLDDSWF